MELNFRNIPMAIIYFILGVFVNIVLYYILSPSEVDLIGIMADIFTPEATTTGVIWVGIMAITIMINILLPVWMLVEKDE